MDKKKLYLIEGIPGSGKTTFAKLLANKLQEQRQSVHLYVENDLHPTDLAWCAVLSQNEYEKVLQVNGDLAFDIMKNSAMCGNYHIVAYTKIPTLTPELYGYFESKEIYDGRVSSTTFCKLHDSRWKMFGQTARDTNIFECSLLQNSVNELLLFGCQSKDSIMSYIYQLLDDVSGLDPEIMYLNVDVEKVLDRAAKERVDANNNRVWEQMIIKYVENSPFGKRNNLQGIEGMKTYFTYRKELELEILEQLSVKKDIISVNLENQGDIIRDWMRQSVTL